MGHILGINRGMFYPEKTLFFFVQSPAGTA
jgi:hypothetical protein